MRRRVNLCLLQISRVYVVAYLYATTDHLCVRCYYILYSSHSYILYIYIDMEGFSRREGHELGRIGIHPNAMW